MKVLFATYQPFWNSLPLWSVSLTLRARASRPRRALRLDLEAVVIYICDTFYFSFIADFYLVRSDRLRVTIQQEKKEKKIRRNIARLVFRDTRLGYSMRS